MHRGGYTIVEFLIAIAVSVVIAAIGIPRYNAYIRQQDFLASGQAIANCLTRAQQGAAAPTLTTVPARYSMASIRQSSPTSLSCSYAGYPGRVTNNSLTVSVLLLGTVAPVSPAAPEIKADNTVFSGTAADPVRVVFGTLENGAPLGYQVAGVLLKQPDTAGPSYVPFGTGFSWGSTEIRLRSASDPTLCGALTMSQLGLPIRFEVQSSCI